MARNKKPFSPRSGRPHLLRFLRLATAASSAGSAASRSRWASSAMALAAAACSLASRSCPWTWGNPGVEGGEGGVRNQFQGTLWQGRFRFLCVGPPQSQHRCRRLEFL
jgi:hypothetical protein